MYHHIYVSLFNNDVMKSHVFFDVLGSRVADGDCGVVPFQQFTSRRTNDFASPQNNCVATCNRHTRPVKNKKNVIPT